jgi:hypothetical protein
MLEEDMMLRRSIAIFISLLLAVSTGSCGKPTNLPATIFNETSPTSSSISASSSVSSAFTLTPTFQVITSSPTATNDPKHTPASLPAISIITPTLSIEDTALRLQGLLKSNGNCLLPCLWGIAPGISTARDGQVILEPLSSISLFTFFDSNHGTIDLLITLDDLDVLINVSLLTYPNNEIVGRIRFEARAMQEMADNHTLVHVFNSDEFGELINIYTISQILSEYGRPFSVLISTLAEPLPQERGGDTGDFRLILLYPSQGILVNYNTNIHVIGENVAGCITNAHVELELFPSGNEEQFLANLDPSLQEDIQDNFEPLDEVTNMTIDDFYQLYRYPNDECLESPSVLWPVPER